MTSGRDLITSMIRGAATTSQFFSSQNTYLHVGDSTGTFGSSQDAAGSSGANWFSMGLDAGFPTSTAANVITYQATATTSQANFAWNEFLTKNSSASSSGAGSALNRLQTALGTKANTQSWAFAAAITVTT